MCLGDVFNRNKSKGPQAPPTDATSGEQIEIDQTVSGSMGSSGSSGRHGHQRKGSTARAGGVKGPRSSKKSSSTSKSSGRGRTGTPSSSRGGGRSRSRGGGRGR